MSNENRVSAEISPESLQRILGALATLRAELPFLITVTPQERREMAKLGDKSVAFDEKCVSYMQTHPDFLPGFVKADELAKDRALRSQMQRFAAEMNALSDAVEDTLSVVGSEIWMADLAYYQNVREGARRGLDGAQGIYEDLRQRFPRGSRTPATSALKNAS